MKNNSDIGENTAILLFTGIVVGGPLLFLGWLVKQALSQPLPPAPTAVAALAAAPELKQVSFFERIRFSVEQQTREVMRHQ